jgi:hypothetical protein
MARKIKKTLLSTLVILGEGACEKAFLAYLKDLYAKDTGQKITLQSADGGSPEDIVKTAIKKSRDIAYDRKFILMDSDIKISDKAKSLAKESNITIILSEPLCLEGMLLKLLDQKVPTSSQKCKSLLHPQLDGKATDKHSYRKLITVDILEQSTIEQIVLLLRIIKNRKL